MKTSKILVLSALSLSSLAAVEAAAQNSNVGSNPSLPFKQEGVITGVRLTSRGEGYTSAPNVILVGGGGSGALVRALIDPRTQQVSSLELVNPGTGYTSAPIVVISGGGGRGATAAAAFSDIAYRPLPVSDPGTAPDRPTPDRPTPDRPTPDRPTPDRPTPDRPTPDRPTPDQPTPDQPTPDQPTPDQPTPDRPTPDRPTPDQPTPDQPTPDRPTPDRPTPDRPTPDRPTPDQPTPDQPTPDQPTPDQPKPDQPKPDKPKPDQPKPDQPKPDQPKPDQPKPDQPKPDQPKPDKPKPDQPKPDQPKPDQPKPDQPKPDKPKPDQPKPKIPSVDWRPIMGRFQSLLTRTDDASGAGQTPGRVTVTIGGKGAASGILEYEGLQYRFAAPLSAKATYTRVLNPMAETPLTIALSLRTDSEGQEPGSNEVRATSVEVEVIEGQGDLSSNATVVDAMSASILPVSIGNYTMVYSGENGFQGYAALNSSRSGVVTFLGRTADGKGITSSALKKSDGSIPFYQSFSWRGVPQGRLAGVLYIDPLEPELPISEGQIPSTSPDIDSPVHGQLELRVPESSSEPGDLSVVEVTGSRYTQPRREGSTSNRTEVMELEVFSPQSDHLFSQTVVRRANGRMKVDGENWLRLDMNANPRTGLISGRYVDEVGNEHRIDGVSLQDGGLIQAFSRRADRPGTQKQSQ